MRSWPQNKRIKRCFGCRKILARHRFNLLLVDEMRWPVALFETLTKAQRTRGLRSSGQSNFLRSYHKFKHKSASTKNLNQTTASPQNLKFKVLTKPSFKGVNRVLREASNFRFEWNCSWVGRLISISVNIQEVLIQNVPHHFQIALLPAVESLITLTNCGRQLTQLFWT